MEERLHAVLREAAALDELGPGACTAEGLGAATGYGSDEVGSLMTRAVDEGLARFDQVRGAWTLTSTGLESIETV